MTTRRRSPQFIGRNGGSGDGFGIDAALDFPLFFKLPAVAKGMTDVGADQRVFLDRKQQERSCSAPTVKRGGSS